MVGSLPSSPAAHLSKTVVVLPAGVRENLLKFNRIIKQSTFIHIY